MTTSHHLMRAHPLLAALLLAAALLLRVLVPAGFMPTVAGGRLTLTLCSGVTATMPMAAMPGMTHHDDGSDRARTPCAYADLALPALGSSDAAIVATPPTFGAAPTLLHVTPVAARSPAYLRPPLRGPPAAV